jgi:acid phosphatase
MKRIKITKKLILPGLIILALLIFVISKLSSNFSGPGSDDLNLTDNNIDMVFWGDSGTGDSRQRKVANAIQKLCARGCDLGVIAGDIIYEAGITSSKDPQIEQKLERPYDRINFPIYLAIGNHDNLGCNHCLVEYAAGSDKFKMPSTYYKVKVNFEIDLIVIDTENFDSAQADWLTKVLDESVARHKIVVGHRPLLTYESEHKDERWGTTSKAQEIMCNRADLYISGHSHLLEYNTIENCSVKQIISGAGGAETRRITDKTKPVFYFEDNGFVVVQVKNSIAAVMFYNDRGNLIHRVQIGE